MDGINKNGINHPKFIYKINNYRRPNSRPGPKFILKYDIHEILLLELCLIENFEHDADKKIPRWCDYRWQIIIASRMIVPNKFHKVKLIVWRGEPDYYPKELEVKIHSYYKK